MRVSVRGYLNFRILVGEQEISLDTDDTVRALLDALAPSGGEEFALRVFRAEEGLRPGVAVLVNGRPIPRGPDGLTLPLHDGDEVAIFPPLAGGSCSQSGRPAMPHPAGGRTPRALPGASPAARRVRP